MSVTYIADAFASVSPEILLQGGNRIAFPVFEQFVRSKKKKHSETLHVPGKFAQNKFSCFVYSKTETILSALGNHW